MQENILIVLCAQIGARTDAEHALRRLRRMAESGCTSLLLCDLAPAPAEKMPEDEPLLRFLQSSVMAMAARRPGCFHLLVRRRSWSDAERVYSGAGQPVSIRQLISELLECGRTDTHFEAATVSPASLRGRFSFVLFADSALAFTPDTPLRMRTALEQARTTCIAGRLLHRRAYPESVLDRLMRSGFSLFPLLAAKSAALKQAGLAPSSSPAMFTLDALRTWLGGTDTPLPIAEDCFFLYDAPASLPLLFSQYRSACLHLSPAHVLLPLVQLALLLLSAWLGVFWLAATALLLPELGTLRFVHLLPAALIRLSLLPFCTVHALDALLMRIQARARLFRLRVPPSLAQSRSAMFMGAVLLSCSVVSASALPLLLPVSLLWLGAPFLVPALSAPTIERIPLSEEQQTQLLAEAESAFFDCWINMPESASVPQQMLAACAGSMLHTLEPDEAARRVQALLATQPVLSSASDQAAVLVSAQYLREQMSQCDAAQRMLPSQLESLVSSQPSPPHSGRLDVFLSCIRRGDGSAQAHASIRLSSEGEPADLLFLPLGPAARQPASSVSLSLTHPHTYLRRLPGTLPSDNCDALARFLFLCASALGHPFHALLMRSPVAAPYAPLLEM